MSDPAFQGLNVSATADGVILPVHVQPRAAKNEICGVQGNELKLRLTSPPVEGEANKLCIEFLAKKLRIAKSCINIIGGEKSRHKLLAISGISPADLLPLLAK
nr:DUF167 domain-containing protein [Geotalea uraniireducens]